MSELEEFSVLYSIFSVASFVLILFFAFVAPLMAYLILVVYFSGSVFLFAFYYLTTREEGSA